MDKRKRINKQFTLSILLLITTLFLSIFSNVLKASEESDEALSPNQAFTVNARLLENHTVEVNFAIAPGYLVYQKDFHFRTLNNHPIENHSLKFPEGIKKKDTVLGEYQAYKNQLKLLVPLPKSSQTPSKTLGIVLGFQGCKEGSFCYPPITKQISFSANGVAHIEDIESDMLEEAKPDEVSPIVESETDRLTNYLKNKSLLMIILIFLGCGILLAFTPCVLPMIPILANILVGENTPLSSRRAILLATAYVLSLSLCYALAGALAGLMGSHLQATFQQPLFLVGLSFLLLLFGLSQLNLIQVHLPHLFSQTLHELQYKQKQGSIIGAMGMGAISALVASPCTTAPLVGALTYIGQTGNVMLGGIALFALAFGMGLPLLIVACFGSRFLPKAGPWMNYIKGITGVVLLVLAGFILMRAFPSNALIQTASASLPSHFIEIHDEKELKTALDTARQNNKPVILDVYADWCVSCKQIDKDIFGNKEVLSSLQNAQLLRLDVTQQTKNHNQLQKTLNIVGPPTLIFFGANGEEMKEYRLVGKIDSDDFLNHVSQFLKRNITASKSKGY